MPRPETPMQMDFQSRKARGRLSREDQRRLGDILQRVYDDVVKQGVPDRFREIIEKIDQSTGMAEPDEQPAEPWDRDSQPAPVVRASGSDKPKDQN